MELAGALGCRVIKSLSVGCRVLFTGGAGLDFTVGGEEGRPFVVFETHLLALSLLLSLFLSVSPKFS